MGRNLIIASVALVMLLSTAMLGSAGSTIVVNPLTMQINVGSTGTYALTLDTTIVGPASLTWDTDSSLVVASINGMPLAQNGNIDFISTGGVQTFTLEVKPLSGITVGENHDVSVAFSKGGSTTARALATAGVIPAPELSTVALMSAGMIGMFGLVRIQRRN